MASASIYWSTRRRQDAEVRRNGALPTLRRSLSGGGRAVIPASRSPEDALWQKRQLGRNDRSTHAFPHRLKRLLLSHHPFRMGEHFAHTYGYVRYTDLLSVGTNPPRRGHDNDLQRQRKTSINRGRGGADDRPERAVYAGSPRSWRWAGFRSRFEPVCSIPGRGHSGVGRREREKVHGGSTAIESGRL